MATKVVCHIGGKKTWRLVSTPECYILQYNPKKREGKADEWTNEGYYTSIQHAMDGFAKRYPRITPTEYPQALTECHILEAKVRAEIGAAFTVTY